jgi:cytochrome P450
MRWLKQAGVVGNVLAPELTKAIRDIRLHEQTSSLSPLSAGLLDTIPRLLGTFHIFNFVVVCNPWRWYKFWMNNRAMDGFLRPLIQERLNTSMSTKTNDPAKDKTLVQVLAKVMREESENQSLSYLVESAINETKLALFAGHDTTATTLCWVFHCLAQHPEVVAKLREEHDTILGSNPASAMRILPHLVNSLTYTHAVIKETLRIQTNVGTMRKGVPSFALYGPPGSGYDGMRFPTEGFSVWDGNFAIHRDPDLWPKPTEFIPERWLITDENDPMHPPKNAWRPFELGPRNCIGQPLAIVEMKMVLALVLQSFDMECAWNEWDKLR